MTNDIIYYNTGNIDKNVQDTSPSGYGLLSLISNYTNPVGVEIGSDVGVTAYCLLDNNSNLFINCIDPYIRYRDWNGNDLNDRDNVYEKFISKMNVYKDRYKLYKMTSDDAVTFFKDNSLDFIFVDGLHEYDQVLKDCENYYPKLKSGGLMAGHDYNAIAGVRNAVDVFANRNNKKVNLGMNDIWHWIK